MGEPETLRALPRALAPQRPEASSLNLALALLGAGLLHLVVILGVSFEMPEPRPSPTPDEALEILILQDQGISTDTPAPDSVLSQHSRFGESNQGDAAITVPEAQDAPPAEPAHEIQEPIAPVIPLTLEAIVPTPEPATRPSENNARKAHPAPEQELAEAPDSEPPPLATPAPEVLAAQTAPADPLQALPTATVDAGQILGSRDQEIARLTASLEARTTAYANRQRRKSVSASTREFRYASYLGAWARKVERIGNLNYPQAAKEQHIYGSLILHVAVRKDGSVEAIRVVRSSGHGLLDQAAVNIVELAAPYAPFPPDIAAETDVLDIIRTWQFQRGGKLGWEQ